MDNLDYLFAAFATVWVVIFAYIVFLSRKQRELQREIESLQERVPRATDQEFR